MQFRKTPPFSVISSGQICLAIGALMVASLFCLTGCGGATTGSPLAQTPATQPDPATPAPSSPSPAPSQPSSSPVPASAKTTSAIQALPDWQWCTAKLNGKPCASGLGNATSSLTPNQADPSLSGAASKFTLGGHTAYSNALWWKSFGADSKSTHFVYDLYFYIDKANLPEALEFDINQSMNGVRYTWGTECSYRDTGKWDIWNPEAEKWETTDVPCPEVSSKEWHHLIWEVERVNGQVHYISVTLDDQVTPVDKYYNPQQHFHGNAVSVAFQMDGNYRQDPYTVWLDNVTLSAW